MHVRTIFYGDKWHDNYLKRERERERERKVLNIQQTCHVTYDSTIFCML